MTSDHPNPASGTRQEINGKAWLVDTEDWRNVFVNYAPFMGYAKSDDTSNRACMGMLVVGGVASVREVAEAFEVSHGFVHKLASRIKQEGLDGVYSERPGPRGPSKLTPEIRRFALRHLRKGESTRTVATKIEEEFDVKISHNSIALLKRKKALPRPEPPPAAEQKSLLPAPSSVVITPAELDGVETRYGGAFLYFAALRQLDLVSIWNKIFFWNQKLGYMLSEVVLTLLFLMILRYPTVESSKKAMRRHLAPLLGLDCAPSIPTLRRKIRFLALQKQGEALLRAQAEQAKKAGLLQLGVLYVDGHFKPYYGNAPVSKGYFSQRRLAHPGLMQYFVNDVQGRPVFFLTVEAHVGLIEMLPPVLGEIRDLIGTDAPLTLIFDRGGYSLRLFKWLKEQPHLHFLTYERGSKHDACPDEHFTVSWIEVGGKRKTFSVCDGIETYNTCGELRRIVIRKGNKQTTILSSDFDRSAATIAYMMFHRWGQENFFGYLKQQYKLDALIGYGDESADGDRRVANPSKKAMKEQIAEIEAAIRFYQAQLGEAVIDPYHAERSVQGLKISERVTGEIRELNKQLERLRKEYATIPVKIPLKQLVPENKIRRLKMEKKILVDTLKIQAYLAEDLMVARLAKHYDDPKDIRQVLQVLVNCPARLSTSARVLTVELEPPERPKYERALRALCEDINLERLRLPWGDCRLVFRVADRHQLSTAA